MNATEVYEPPALAEVGGYADLTLGAPPGDVPGRPPRPFPFCSHQA
ncbi:lasso RiPP family leader peptide-containing protein [Spongiactinospora sp. TRM90649]|nr:lasso RiPP family leader peptide-containing protein [Spongiactinospora sp. TRM90649]MDF5752461.1 lasso RiPP family leader peptide-containing protein [Spongiactinospora sp. TRM90649]